MIRFTRFVALAILLPALFVSACSRNSDATTEEDSGDFHPIHYSMGTPVDDPSVAAIAESQYGTDTLHTDFFQMQYDMILDRFPQLAGDPGQQEELRRNIVEEFVRRHVIFGEADLQSLDVEPGMVDQQLQAVKGQFPDEETYRQALAENNMTEDSLRATIREDMRQQMMLERIAESAAQPSDREVEDYRRRQSEEVRAQHILFLARQGVDPGERGEIRQRAEAVLDSVRAGGDFADLARRHSDDGTSAQGGDLGYFSRGQMVPEFERAAFALSDSGDVTRNLVETQYGYHIIRLTGRRESVSMDTTSARNRMMQQRRQETVVNRLRELTEAVTVRLNREIVQTDLNHDHEH
jgi:peptidyl-prolyl cis-trans isomerase C